MPTTSSKERNRGSGSGSGSGGVVIVRKLGPENKSASFHGRLPTEQRAIRRPKTLPDLLEGRRASSSSSSSSPSSPWGGSSPPVPPAPEQPRVPTKVLVNVTVQRSLGPVQVVASTDWTVAHLVAAVLHLYAKEGRRPLLPSTKPTLFALHYSQFSLQCIDGEEKLVGLGSRNFFLCPKVAAGHDGPSSHHPAEVPPEKTCSKEAAAAAAAEERSSSKIPPMLPWLRFMDFLL